MGLLDDLRSDGAESIVHPIQAQKALAYVRVSHDDSADRATSLRTQRQDIERYASREGVEIVEWYEEPGKSAFKEDERRVELARMIRRAKEDAGVSLIVVWKSDRFYRDRYQAATAKGELAKAGVRVVSVLEPYDTRTTSGMVMESVTDAMNQIRSIEIGMVTHRNLLVNCEMRDPDTGWAYKNGGWAQFGYKNHRIYLDTERKYKRLSHCIWVPDDEIVNGKPIHEWARQMLIDWRLRDRLGADAIARKLTEAGVPTPSGRQAWSDTTVDGLLRPEALLQYAGYGLWNRRDFKDGGKRQKDRSEWKIIDRAHPALISQEEADAIHEVRRNRSAPRGKRAPAPSPFILSGGLLRCSHCGANYIGQTRHGDRFYVCGSQIYRHGAGCGASWYVRCEEADRAVFDVIEKCLGADRRLMRTIVNGYNKQIDDFQDFDRAKQESRQAEIARLEGEVENLMKSVAEGLDPASVRTAINERAEQLDRLKAIATSVAIPPKITPKEIDVLANEVRQIAESGDTNRKRSAVRRFIAAIEADPERHSFRVLVHSPSTFCVHSVVAPGGVEPPPRP